MHVYSTLDDLYLSVHRHLESLCIFLQIIFDQSCGKLQSYLHNVLRHIRDMWGNIMMLV